LLNASQAKGLVIPVPGPLQSSLLAGVGYGGAGTINGSGIGDYHYGLTPPDARRQSLDP